MNNRQLNIVKHLLILTAVFFAGLSRADFDLGMEYYEQGKLEKAYQEFMEAAQYGSHAAQFNIGAMHYRGEYVKKDPVEAYAWFALSAQGQEFESRDVHSKIFEKFSDDEKQYADTRYKSLYESYSDRAIEEKLTPVYSGGTPLIKRFRVVKSVVPNYPTSSARAGKTGWVDMFFTIDKDGTTRDHVVYYSSDKAFAKETLRVIRQWQFEPMKINEKPIAVHGVKRRFIFHLEGMRFDEGKITRVMRDMKKKAIDGDDVAKFNYAYFLDALPSYTNKHDAFDNPNEWYMDAARHGSSAASFFLGQNILYGNMCSADSDKSMGWLLKAAAENITDAHYILAVESLSGARFEKNEEKALYWLQRAAVNSPAAQLRYAWILTTHPAAEKRDGALAKTYLDMVDKGYHDKQTLFQVAAAVAAENNDFKAAIDWQTKALKDARSLELPLDYVNQRLAAYNNKQPWREAL